MTKFADRLAVCALATILSMSVTAPAQSAAKQNSPGTAAAQRAADKNASQSNANQPDGLVIEPEELPITYPRGPYHVNFQARGNYVPALHWAVAAGALPPGIVLDDNGSLHGEARRAGEFQFVVTVRDGGQPQQAVQKAFALKVVDALAIAWKVPPHVNVSRIEGSVDVTNATLDDIDLTFDVKAVAENGRATEIGYQHFPLKKGTIAMTLPFGETLPHGAYLVRVDVTGEVARRNAIYKQGLQTPAPLQVIPGP